MKTKLPLVLLALLTTGVMTACSDRPYAISHSTVSDKDYDECKTEAYQAVRKPISLYDSQPSHEDTSLNHNSLEDNYERKNDPNVVYNNEIDSYLKTCINSKGRKYAN